MPGWYRHTPLSTQVMRCKYEFECKGGALPFVKSTDLTKRFNSHESRLVAGDGAGGGHDKGGRGKGKKT